MARSLAVAVAVFRPVAYMAPPTAEEQADRENAGACLVCDMRVKGCFCRRCDGCRRFWLAQKTAARSPDGDHHGIREERCPSCVALGGKP